MLQKKASLPPPSASPNNRQNKMGQFLLCSCTTVACSVPYGRVPYRYGMVWELDLGSKALDSHRSDRTRAGFGVD